ncbi:hypothetical protein EVAR_19199_1 [Eumeta japonica]|uniref:Uncharacterized protein n=1 Tax=Eumeta variegata TaxID=151549 RepID=A0A4C1VEU1_EUMVA|nr:hypothetical protein EVAR_19199_1 [Eumeta japonica]
MKPGIRKCSGENRSMAKNMRIFYPASKGFATESANVTNSRKWKLTQLNVSKFIKYHNIRTPCDRAGPFAPSRRRRKLATRSFITVEEPPVESLTGKRFPALRPPAECPCLFPH